MKRRLPNVIEVPDEPNLWRYGKIDDETLEDYHACGAISRTKLEVFRDSPKLFWKLYVAKVLPKEPPTDALIVGSAVDTLALEGEDEFKRRFIVLPDDAPRRPTVRQLQAKKPSQKTREAIAYWSAFDAANEGKQPLTDDQLELSQRCADALHGDDTFKRLMVGGRSQVTFRLKGEHVALQCRPDYWSENGNELTDGMPCILDVKTIQELPADDDDFLPRHIAKFGYHHGAYLYPQIVSEVMQYKDGYRPPFILCFVEKKEPYAVTCRLVDDKAIEIGGNEVRDSINKLIRCKQTGVWPEWWNAPLAKVGLPQYYVRKSLEGLDGNLWG